MYLLFFNPNKRLEYINASVRRTLAGCGLDRILTLRSAQHSATNLSKLFSLPRLPHTMLVSNN